MGPLEFYIHINDSIENFINWSVKETRGLDCTLVQTAGRLNGSHNTSCIWIGRTLHSHKVVLLSSPSARSLSLFSLVLVLWYLSLEQQSSGGRRGVQTRSSSCCYQSEPTSAGFTSPQDPLRHARQTQTWPPVRPYVKSTEAVSAQPYPRPSCKTTVKGASLRMSRLPRRSFRQPVHKLRVNICSLFDVDNVVGCPELEIAQLARGEFGCGFRELFSNPCHSALKHRWLASPCATRVNPNPLPKCVPTKKKVSYILWWKPFPLRFWSQITWVTSLLKTLISEGPRGSEDQHHST